MCSKWTCIICGLAVYGLIAPSVAQQVEPGLVGWWKLDETTGLTAADSSGFGSHGTLVNTSQGHWTTGMRGGALELFGNREYINCGTGSNLDTANDFTLAAWVQLAPGTDGRYGGIAGKLTRKNGDADYWGFALVRHSSNVFRLWVADGNAGAINASASSDATYTDTAWHHVVGIRKGKSNYLYVDGVQQKATSTSEFIPSKEFFHIGRQYNYLDDRYFAGLIDDVRLYNRALSTAEVVVLAARPKAHDPTPTDGEKDVLMPLLRWKPGTGSLWHDVYLGTTPDLGQAEFVIRLTQPMYFPSMPLDPGTVYYWRVDEVATDKTTIVAGDVWSFSTVYETAYAPTPFNGARWVDLAVELTWSPGPNAESHDVYFSTSREDVVAGAPQAFKGTGVEPKFTPGALAAQTTYYWRIDDYDAAGAKTVGPVWSFTTIGPGAGVMGEYFNNMGVSGQPALTRIEPEINFNWGDPGSPGEAIRVDGFSCRWTAELEVPFTERYTFITNSDDGVRLWVDGDLLIDNWTDHSPTENRGRITLTAGQVYTLVMEMYENTGGATAQLYWMSPSIARQIIPAGPLQPPLRAREPKPANQATDITQTPVLHWMAGERAVQHDMYFGTDATAVAQATPATAGIYQARQVLDATSFTPGALEWNKTYYWRVDEVNEADSQSPWRGSVWSFTTAGFVVVDDFEGYTSDLDNRIFQAWIDGAGYTEPAPGNPGNGTGSTVGTSTDPWVELRIVHGGKQAMPLAFNNADSPFYSEAERTWASPQNWTVNGMNTLSLQVRGYPQITTTAVTETGGKMTLTGDGADIWNNNDEFTYAYKSLSGDATIVARVVSIGAGSNTWAKGGVMIRDSLDGGSMHAMMVMTANTDGAAGNGGSFQYRNATDGASGNSDSTGAVAPPYWVKIERMGDTFTGYHSPDGSAWTMVGTQEVILTAPVYIGICVTSHQAGEQRTFQFDNIKTIGSVTGQWQGAVIASPKYNSAQDLYVEVQDNTNRTAVVANATAVNSADWVEVQMPLGSFNGVNMTKVKKMFIGVGNRNNPVADGSGMLFIDDIRVIAR